MKTLKVSDKKLNKKLCAMLPYRLKSFIVLFLLLLAIPALQGQQSGMSEEDVIEKAQSHFDQESWQEALPLFAQLVSIYPENSEYNYKFGVCSLLGNRTDRRRPIRYLTNALKSIGDNKELNYYLGLAYYQNEEFANAMKYFNLYLSKLDADSPERPQILEKVNACLNGMNLEHKNMIGEVIVKNEFQKDNFHRAYRADEFTGSLILKPENFVTDNEKQSGENSFVYISEPRGTLYFSGYEDKSSDQRDLFKVTLEDNGDWGDPEKISDAVNTKFDEAYPIVTENGTTLFFSSKGHNSMGGYDVFKSSIDPETNEFSQPENMGIGINSPFDDILFIPDKSGNAAYFASDRDNLNNGINVFKIALNQDPFADQQMLADNNIQTKLNGINTEAQSNNSVDKSSIEPETQIIARTEPKVDPKEKAANLVRQRNRVNKLADTAYMLVTQTKSLIRELTNKRDRANMISNKKLEKAKSLEVEFENTLATLPLAQNKEEFEKELVKTIKLKREIYQNRQRADQANLIAWKIGKHIKVKDAELEKLKKEAGEVQTLSLSGDYNETDIVYTTMMDEFMTADTLTDYSQNIVWISGDKVEFTVPDTEMAYVETMRKGYENQTLLATQQKSANIEEDIPINVIDNRNTVQPQAKPPAVVVLAQVAQVSFDELAYNPEPETESELELNFDIDAIEPYQLIETIAFADVAFAEVDEQELEISFAIDRIAPRPLINTIVFDETSYALNVPDEELEINERIDWIQPAQLIEQIAYTELVSNDLFDEEVLEINGNVDRIDPIKLVEKVSFTEFASLELMEDEDLEINIRIDWVDPAKLVEQVVSSDVEFAMNTDEDLEIDFAVDAIQPQQLIEQIEYADNAEFSIDETDLELNTTIDAIEPSKLVESIAFIDPIESMELDEESLDIKFNIDQVQAMELVQKVNYTDLAVLNDMDDELEIRIENEARPEVEVFAIIEPVSFNDEDLLLVMEDQLDIRLDKETITPIDLIDQVEFNDNALAYMPQEEVLEIRVEQDKIEMIKQIEPVTYTDIAFNALDIDNEELAIDFTADAITMASLVQPVMIDDLAYNDVVVNEQELEISVEEDAINPVEIYKQVEMVSPAELLAEDLLAYDDVVELDFSIDEADEVFVFDLVQEVSFTELAFTEPAMEEELELSFSIDANQGDEYLMADNSQISERDVAAVNSIPSVGSELFYLRESVSIATDIETSRTDYEMLRLALANPEDLSYEELLFAASLAHKPEDKLMIYNYAFIHIDRDWRAFNNAAVTAMNIKDLDQAEVFLYQASLISDENGKIMNNMGILACHKNDYNSAQDHFIAATERGVNADYNLQVI